nr:MAG TPA: hypothetical protein [Caudoviricetes sp.]
MARQLIYRRIHRQENRKQRSRRLQNLHIQKKGITMAWY